MGEQEVRTADASGVVKVQSPQQNPTPKKSAKASGRSGSRGAKNEPLKVNERGVAVTQWDDPALDPNKRASIAEDPTGESNAKK